VNGPPQAGWDFSERQWAKILGSMRGLERPGEYWLETGRTDLRKALNRYLSSVDLERAPTARIGKWKKIERRVTELRKAIRALDDPRDGLILDQIETETKVKADEVLRNLRAAAGLMMRSLGQQTECAIDHRPASKVLHHELLRIWMFLGGELRGELGYRQINNEPCGPLISFMQAVMGPVLGKPVAAETIRNWIREEERLHAELREGYNRLQQVSTGYVDSQEAVEATLIAGIRAAAAWVPPLKEEMARFELVVAMERRKVIEEIYGEQATGLKNADLQRVFDILCERMSPYREAMMQRLGYQK